MAHIELRQRSKRGLTQLLINGTDYSLEVYDDAQIVEVGEGDTAEVGFRVTFVVSRLDLDNEADVVLTDHVLAVATRVRSMIDGDES